MYHSWGMIFSEIFCVRKIGKCHSSLKDVETRKECKGCTDPSEEEVLAVIFKLWLNGSLKSQP